MTETPGQERGLGRRALLRNALITGAGAVALGAMSIPLAGAAHAGSYQDNWGWCNRCNEIFWATGHFTNAGACPAGGSHTLGGTNYSAMYNFSTSGNPANTSSAGQQAGWRWCQLCSALFWPGTPQPPCPGNTIFTLGVPTSVGDHVAGGTNYAVPFGIPSSTYQDGWVYCSLCGVLYWGGQWGKDAENCFAAWPNGKHTAGSDTHYQMIFT